MPNPTTIYFRHEHETGAADATPFTGRFTHADPYVVHDGALGDDEVEILMEAIGATYADMAGEAAPGFEFVDYSGGGGGTPAGDVFRWRGRVDRLRPGAARMAR